MKIYSKPELEKIIFETEVITAGGADSGKHEEDMD